MKQEEPKKSERYIKTMEFFNQLREPERTEAINNYDEDHIYIKYPQQYQKVFCMGLIVERVVTVGIGINSTPV